MDSGVDYDHRDLKNVMYEFSSELQDELGCGKYGYAPARENKKDPMDGDGHGTHCAGIVAAEWNGYGVSGVASGAQLCAVSVAASTSDSDFSYDSIIKGYDFLVRAANAGVDIRAVNRSLSMDPATNANDVMVKAAGLDEGSIVYVCGDLFFVDGHCDPDDWNGPYNLRIRRFDDQYGLTTEGKLLDHQYTTPDLPPKVAVKGNSIYVYCRGYMGGEETSFDRAMGLERIDVASDSSLSSTDLSAVFSGLKEPPPSDSTCIAVSDEGVFLISSSLEGLLPDGAKRTDTFLLKNGATTFEPYPRRLSFAPFTNPVALCADGWLYAYGVSQYEDTPVFGRATKVHEEKPDPVDPQPDDSDKDRRPSSLPKTADSALASTAVISTLSFAGMVCIAGGLAARRES